MQRKDGYLIFGTKIDETGVNKGLDSVLSSIKSKLIKIGSLTGITLGLKDAIKEAEKYQNAITGLTSIMEGQGRSVQKATSFIQAYTKDGLVPQTEAITAYKNLALRGYDTSQIEKVMNALKDSATYGRQASYTLGEAVMTATEGLKNENSILVDNAGVTKNVAKMWDEYAKSIGTTSNRLTQAQKIQAEVNGILEETKFQLGDSATYADSYSGRMARLGVVFKEFQQNLGGTLMNIVSAVAPALEWLMNKLLLIANIFRALVEVMFGITGQTSKSQQDAIKNTNQATKSMDKYGKAVDKAAKASSNLAGFDKLNVLSSDKGGGAAGGIGGDGGGFSFQGEGLDGFKMPDMIKATTQLEKIKKIIQEIEPLLKGMFAGVAMFYLLKFLGNIENLRYQWALFKMALKSKDGFKDTQLGLSIMVAGIVTLYTSITKMLNSWDEMSTKEKVLTASFAVLGAAAIALGYSIATGISVATLGIGAIIAAVVGAVTVIINFIAKLVKEEKAIKSVKKATEDLKKAKEDLKKSNEGYISAVDSEKDALKKLQDAQKQHNISGKELNKLVEDGTLKYEDMSDAQKEVYKAYVDHVNASKELIQAKKDLKKSQEEEKMASWEKTLALDAEKGNYEDYKNKVIQAYQEGSLSAEQAQELISRSMGKMSKKSQETFTQDIPKDIKDGLDPKKYQSTLERWSINWNDFWERTGERVGEAAASIKNKWQEIKEWFGNLIDGFTQRINDFKDKVVNKFTELKNKVITMFQKGGQIFNGIKDGIGNLFKKIVNGLINGINVVIKKPFDMINGLLNKIRNVEIMGFTPFNGLWKNNPLPVPQIPKLAQGAVIPPNAEFLAILGDQRHGRNLEAPEGLIRQIIREEMGQNKGEIVQYITNPIYLDGNKIAEQTIKKIINIQEREGVLL